MNLTEPIVTTVHTPSPDLRDATEIVRSVITYHKGGFDEATIARFVSYRITTIRHKAKEEGEKIPINRANTRAPL